MREGHEAMYRECVSEIEGINVLLEKRWLPFP